MSRTYANRNVGQPWGLAQHQLVLQITMLMTGKLMHSGLKVPHAPVISMIVWKWSIHYASLSATLNLLHSSTNQELFKSQSASTKIGDCDLQNFRGRRGGCSFSIHEMGLKKCLANRVTQTWHMVSIAVTLVKFQRLHKLIIFSYPLLYCIVDTEIAHFSEGVELELGLLWTFLSLHLWLF